jgi:hypothetical protein
MNSATFVRFLVLIFLESRRIKSQHVLATMAKRTNERPVEDGNQVYLKRQKIKHVTSSAEEIQSSIQLQQLLAFDQNVVRAKYGNLELAPP